MHRRFGIMAVAVTLSAVVVGIQGAPPAGAWCYITGNAQSATMDWEANGSDLNITYGSTGMDVIARNNLGYSQPTTSIDWVRNVGTKTKDTAGWTARSKGYSNWQKISGGGRYGPIYATPDKFARRFRDDVQACT